jgi:hypothetical protein
VSDALDLVWRRAELRDHVLTASELALWRTNQRDVILQLGVLRRTSDATALMCEDCGPPHPVEIIRDARKPDQPYYLCPDIGRVSLGLTDLNRWEVDFDRIATLVRETVGLTSKPSTLVASRIWLLGRKRVADAYCELFLMCGLCWPDGIQLLSECSRLQQSPAPVLLVPHRLPSGPATSVPIRTLSELVSLEGPGLAVDLTTLEVATATMVGHRAELGKKAPRKRMSRTLGSPEALRVVTDHLEQTKLTDTQFGNQFDTTDRTVRSFRSTGKMRRSNFEAMAKSMGLTTEDLLLGVPPPAIKRPARG